MFSSQMAITTALSCNNLVPKSTNKLPYSTLFPQTTFSFPRKSFNLIKPPVFSICHSRFDGSGYEETEPVDESFYHNLVEEESDDEDDETESSVDLFMRFLQSMFKKVSKRAKKASRSILPAGISPQLVSFAVDGVLLLAAVSIVKALLEVVCTIGGTVFIVILLLRVVWAAVSYFQSIGNGFNQGEGSFGSSQPVI